MKKREEKAKWTTSKTSLFLAMMMIVVYTIINLIYGFINAYTGVPFTFDSTLTSEWFEFWKWVVAGSGTVSVFKLINAEKITKKVTRKKRATKAKANDSEALG